MPALHEIVKFEKKKEKTVQEILAEISHEACQNHGRGLHRCCFIVDRAYAAALEAQSDLPLVEEN